MRTPSHPPPSSPNTITPPTVEPVPDLANLERNIWYGEMSKEIEGLNFNKCEMRERKIFVINIVSLIKLQKYPSFIHTCLMKCPFDS
ncbi:hypothetical protein Hanom_Chr10g00965681 [Helianthus anomalus]